MEDFTLRDALTMLFSPHAKDVVKFAFIEVLMDDGKSLKEALKK